MLSLYEKGKQNYVNASRNKAFAVTRLVLACNYSQGLGYSCQLPDSTFAISYVLVQVSYVFLPLCLSHTLCHADTLSRVL